MKNHMDACGLQVLKYNDTCCFILIIIVSKSHILKVVPYEIEFLNQLTSVVFHPQEIVRTSMDNELLEVQQVTSGHLKGIHLSILSDEDAVSGQSCI